MSPRAGELTGFAHAAAPEVMSVHFWPRGRSVGRKAMRVKKIK